MDGRREGRSGKCVLRVGSSVTNTCQQGGNHRAHASLPAAGDPVLEAGCKSLLPGITTSVFHSSHLQQRFRTENIYWFILPHIRGDSSHIFHVFVENAITKHRLHPEVAAASLNSLYCCLKKKSDYSPNEYVTEVSFYSVFHRVSGGELFERIIDEDFELTERECIKYMKQISEGVQYIHKQGIVHLDLKPENIMCVNKTGTSIKLIDFGLARRLGNEFYFSITGGKGRTNSNSWCLLYSFMYRD